MKKHSIKTVLAGLAAAALFILLAQLLALAIKFGFRIVLAVMENPVEALATAILFLLGIWVLDLVKKTDSPETK